MLQGEAVRRDDKRHYDARTGVGAQAEALAKLAAAARTHTETATRRKSNAFLRRALKAWKTGDAPKTAKHALAATQADEANAQAFHLLAIALEKLGHLHKALVTYQKAFELDPDDPDLLLNLGLTAWNLGLLDGAERMFRLHIRARPDQPAGYNNLGTVQRDKGDLTTAIETLRAAIYRMPQEAMLWNTLATALAEDGRVEESLVFYHEALRIDPDFARVWHNLGYAYSHLGRLEKALEAYDRALALSVHASDRLEGRHSRGVCLIGMGRLEDGFPEYEVRHAPEFRASVLHWTKAPKWNGEDLAGKRVLIVGEQGLGDELMFANTLPDMARLVGADGKLQIAVDPRLVALFQRSFPQAEVGIYEDRKTEAKYVRIFEWAKAAGEPDFYAPMGTTLPHLRKRATDFPRQAFLVPDPERAARFRDRLAALGPGPRIGICWRSMIAGAQRKKYYSAIEAWAPILSFPGAHFVNLQYGDAKAELAFAQEKLGVKIHAFDDLDLRNDIDGAAALSAACDLVISAPTAAAALAGAVGTDVWFLTAGRTWPQLGSDCYPWYRSSRVLSPERFGDWDALMPRVRAALEHFTAEREAA